MKIKVNPAAYQKQFKIQSLQCTNANLLSQIQELKQANSTLSQSISSKSATISDLTQRIEVTTIQKQIQSEDQTRKEKLIHHLEKQVGELLETREEYQRKKERYCEEIREMEGKLKREEDGLAKGEQKLMVSDQRVTEEEQGVEKMRMRNKEVLEEIRRMRETILDKEGEITVLNNKVTKGGKEPK